MSDTLKHTIAIHELGHVAAYWEFGEIHDAEIIDGCRGGSSYMNHRPEFLQTLAATDSDGTLTAEQTIIAKLAGAAAEYTFCDSATYDSVERGMESDLSSIERLIDEETYFNIFDSVQWDTAVALIRRYEKQIRLGAKLVVKRGAIDEQNVSALMQVTT